MRQYHICVHPFHIRKHPCHLLLKFISMHFSSLLVQEGDHIKVSVVVLHGNERSDSGAGVMCAVLSLGSIITI